MSIWNYLFKAKAAKSTVAVEDDALPVAERISENDIAFHLAWKILKGQQSVATFLNMKTKSISKPKMRLLFIGFLMVGVAYCLYLILSALIFLL